MIFILLFFILMILSLNYLYANKSLFSPAVFLSLCALVSVLFTIMNYTNWNLSTMSLKTVMLIVLGVASFSLSASFAQKYIFRFGKLGGSKLRYYGKATSISSYAVPKWLLVFSSLACVIILIMYYNEIMAIAAVGKAMYPIKDYPILWYVTNVDTGMHISRWTNNLTDVAYVLAHLIAFYATFNVVNEKKILKYIFAYIPLAAYSGITILFGGRNMVLQMIITILVLVYFFQVYTSGMSYEVIVKKNIRKIVIIGILTLVAFYGLNNASGRADTGLSGIYYISMYLGSGIKNFDTFLARFSENANVFWGQETFAGMYSSLKGLFGIDYGSPALEYAGRINGYAMGNVYTAIRRYYHDFGLIGVIVFSSLFGFLMGSFYKKINLTIKKFRTDATILFEPILLIYGNLLYGVAIFLIEDYLYISVLSLDTLLRYIELIVGNWLFIKLRIIKRVPQDKQEDYAEA